MKKNKKKNIIIISLLLLLPVMLFLGYTFLLADFFSGPSEQECVKMTERFLGCKLGRDYQIMEYDAKYYHPDRQLKFSIKLPEKRFQKVIEYCKKEMEVNDGLPKRTSDKNYTYIESFLRTEQGFQKNLEILYLDNLRVRYQVINVILNEELIDFCGSNY